MMIVYKLYIFRCLKRVVYVLLCLFCSQITTQHADPRVGFHAFLSLSSDKHGFHFVSLMVRLIIYRGICRHQNVKYCTEFTFLMIVESQTSKMTRLSLGLASLFVCASVISSNWNVRSIAQPSGVYLLCVLEYTCLPVSICSHAQELTPYKLLNMSLISLNFTHLPFLSWSHSTINIDCLYSLL